MQVRLIYIITSILLAPAVLRAEGPKTTTKVDSPVQQAVRTFMVAMFTKDEATLRTVTLPADGFEWLLKGEDIPPNLIDGLKEAFSAMPLRELKDGDDITPPGKEKKVVPAGSVTPEHAIVLLPNPQEPTPVFVHKVEGKWKVDAGPFIAARKAAEEARKNEMLQASVRRNRAR